MSKPQGVLICVPAYGQTVTAQTMESVFKVGQLFTGSGIRHALSWFSAADIVEVRNLFLTVWYDCHKEFSHLLFIDADMGFEPLLIRDMIKFDKPLTGVFYARRQATPSVVGGALETDHSLKDVRHGFLPASYIGGGVMLIKRTMVDEMLRKMPELIDALPSVLENATPFPMTRFLRCFDTILQGDRRLSEDVSFCHRWRVDCGGEIWANVDYPISHVGPFDYKLRYAGVMERKEEAAKQAEAA